MPFLYCERPLSQPTPPQTPQRPRLIQVLAYTVVLSCVLGVIQSSITGISAAPTLSKLVHSEDLDVVGIGGSLGYFGSGPGHYDTANEPRRGLVLGRRHAKIEVETTADNILNGVISTTLLVEKVTGDQSLPASPTFTPPGDQKETKALDAPATQTVIGQITKDQAPSSTAGPSGLLTEPSVSKNLGSQSPDTSLALQSSPSATREIAQETTTKNANNDQSIGKWETSSSILSLLV